MKTLEERLQDAVDWRLNDGFLTTEQTLEIVEKWVEEYAASRTGTFGGGQALWRLQNELLRFDPEESSGALVIAAPSE